MTDFSQDGSKSGEFTGRHMLYIVLAFFGVIITVNVTMAVLAVSSWTGLVVPNSYVASQHFNEKLEAAAAQKARGWKSGLQVSGSNLRFRLQDRNGTPLRNFKFTARFEHPVLERNDFTVKLLETEPGVYQATVSPAPGRWTVSVTGKNTAAIAYRQDFETEIEAERAETTPAAK